MDHTKRVLIKISDPWELGEALKWRPLAARILRIENNDCLLKLEIPFTAEGYIGEYFIGSPRHESGNISELLKGNSVFCSLTGISSEQAMGKNPFDTSKWRGGIAIIGDLEPV